MTSFALEGIINPFSILAIAIDKTSPASFCVPKQLLMLLCVNLRPWAFINQQALSLRFFTLHIVSLVVGNRSCVLQPEKMTNPNFNRENPKP